MIVTARAEYACMAMLELAIRHSHKKPVRLSEVAEKHEIPQLFLVQILLQMKAAGLVGTTRGKAGGYYLTRPPEKITLNEILGVLDRIEVQPDRNVADSELANRLQAVWKKLATARTKILSEITLSDLIPVEPTTDYMI